MLLKFRLADDYDKNLTCCKSDSRAAPILTPAMRDDDAASSAFETDQIRLQLPQQHPID